MPFDTAPTPFIPYRDPAAHAMMLDRALPSPATPTDERKRNRHEFSISVLEFLFKNLARFGNVLNEEHGKALAALVGCLTNLAAGVVKTHLIETSDWHCCHWIAGIGYQTGSRRYSREGFGRTPRSASRSRCAGARGP